ncbi:MAG: signal peptidase I, partial [Candidatus Woesearchaeota archaeon]|nr:signal peptidase I [Candidatus Woesearchaeota archaeon]
VSPYDHVPEDNIKVYSDKVVIALSDPSWASFTDTNSMDPVLDTGANSIEIKPANPKDVHVGDIISFKTVYSSGIVIHRVSEIGEDETGTFYLTKGDNNPTADPGKRRFEDIVGIVVGVIY